jgi:hypothetical protein
MKTMLMKWLKPVAREPLLLVSEIAHLAGADGRSEESLRRLHREGRPDVFQGCDKAPRGSECRRGDW